MELSLVVGREATPLRGHASTSIRPRPIETLTGSANGRPRAVYEGANGSRPLPGGGVAGAYEGVASSGEGDSSGTAPRPDAQARAARGCRCGKEGGDSGTEKWGTRAP